MHHGSRPSSPRALVAALGVALVALASAPACGSGRPPILSNELDDGGADTGLPSLTTDSGAPSCASGPTEGVCGCLDLPLLTKPPNLYFILDRSGSMSDSDKWDTVRDAITTVMIDVGPRANFGVAVFPSPDDEANQCSPGIEVMSVRRGDSPPGRVGPTAYAMQAATQIPAAGGTPTAATFTSLQHHLASFHEPTYAILATDGGPNCDSGITCTTAECITNIESAAPGCTPDGSVNCCTPNETGPLNCLDGDATIAAIAALRAAGVPTYVMGIPGSGPYATLLDQMAVSGGTSRSTEPYYYPVETTDQGAFYGALSKIAAKVTATCTFPLGLQPPDPSLVNVYFNEHVVPQAGPNGWSLDATTLLVTLLGTACSQVLDGDVLDIRIVSGCPTVEK